MPVYSQPARYDCRRRLTDHGIYGWVDDEWQKWKWQWDEKREQGQETSELTAVDANRWKRKWLVREKCFEFKVILARGEGEGRANRVVESVACWVEWLLRTGLAKLFLYRVYGVIVAIFCCTAYMHAMGWLKLLLRVHDIRLTVAEWSTHSPATLGVTGSRPSFGDSSKINFYSLQHIMVCVALHTLWCQRTE